MANLSIKHSFGEKAAAVCVFIWEGDERVAREPTGKNSRCREHSPGRGRQEVEDFGFKLQVRCWEGNQQAGRHRKVSLREGVWGRWGLARLQTGSAEPQELGAQARTRPLRGWPRTSLWLHVEHSCRAGARMHPLPGVGSSVRGVASGRGSCSSGQWCTAWGPIPTPLCHYGLVKKTMGKQTAVLREGGGAEQS